VGYVWQKSLIDKLGTQIKASETRLNSFREQNEKLRKQLATMRSPTYLELRIRELNLGLGPPQPMQVWRVPEPDRHWPAPLAEQQLALRGE
jgi:hypothetical protein